MVSAAAKQKIQTIINDNPVAVFSKSYCPYCKSTKATLAEMGAKVFIIELDEVNDGKELQNALQEFSGQRTVPNIYIDKVHIGGDSDLQSKRGELPGLLIKAGAI